MIQRRREDKLLATFRSLGAVSPANARAAKDFPVVDAATFDNLLRSGRIREGAPGTFYLYEPPPGPARWALQVLFFVAVIALPVGIIQFCGPSQ